MTYSTRIVISPVKGLTWRQWKIARAFLKRHRKKFGSDSGDKLMQNANLVYAWGMALSERKHRWDNG